MRRSPIVKRYDWTSGTIYTAYDSSDTDLFSKKFYVLNSAYGVYKCISNNGGIASTVEPTGTGTSLIVTGDGYVWKYMYTIGTSDAANFLLNDWMPVKTNSTVAAAAVDGAIEYIKVTNGGTGYTSATASIVTTSSGSGAVLTPVISGGIITGITVTTKGTLYRNATVNIVRTGGSGVAATATVSVTPFGGHGKDAPRELGCRHLLVLVDLQGDESGFFPVGDDYRKIGVIHNPKESDGTTLATNDRYAAASL